MRTTQYVLISTIVFSLAALLHALRVLFGWELTLGGTVIPAWVSVIAVLVTGFLAWSGFRASRQ